MWMPADRALVGDFGSGQALTDEQFRLLEPLIPPARPGGRPRSTDIRNLLDGLFFLARTGCQWRHLPPPPAFPPWRTVYGYLRAFVRDGVWEGTVNLGRGWQPDLGPIGAWHEFAGRQVALADCAPCCLVDEAGAFRSTQRRTAPCRAASRPPLGINATSLFRKPKVKQSFCSEKNESCDHGYEHALSGLSNRRPASEKVAVSRTSPPNAPPLARIRMPSTWRLSHRAEHALITWSSAVRTPPRKVAKRNR